MSELAEKAFRLMGLTEEETSPKKEGPSTPSTSVETEQDVTTYDSKVVSLLGSDREPGKCETCRAGGYWPGHGSGLWCFYEAMFLGKSAKAQPASVRRKNCPLLTHSSQP